MFALIGVVVVMVAIAVVAYATSLYVAAKGAAKVSDPMEYSKRFNKNLMSPTGVALAIAGVAIWGLVIWKKFTWAVVGMAALGALNVLHTKATVRKTHDQMSKEGEEVTVDAK